MAGVPTEIELQSGLRYLPGRLTRDEQEALVETIRGIVTEAPLYVPVMPGSGRPMSVRMTNCGSLGWVTDKERGYRYQPLHPLTGKPWPPIPPSLIALWQDVTGYPLDPEACLVNFYANDAKMGLHQDRDEANLGAPVLSISLGNTCLFRIGGLVRTDRTKSLKLASGDVFVLGGEGRLCFHGVDRIYPGTSTLLKAGGRINLTLRRVNP
ncbi:alpha-ketoglutarate-dependent dioxygenase AlkB family protein [Peteryoungia ipomoeae]|uniref:Alpha-ketoglutarate-dependent dioxygenase AlkB n=1 Tax=Peteryoungia ipomoeae TaxID=1210932 RepID=A0A4S8P367_9HYPH|nr:alpha-ketoglutarate-dependent dioxygenase AlkB [Peteryoungia ipomoeae]THV22124.1 alpha-ketoglutarate-dependent dioxygenase AlkB [Peteryoungia ipomoeae]